MKGREMYTMDTRINIILDEYRKSFSRGIIPSEGDLRSALYSHFGEVKVTNKNMIVSDCSGNIIQKFDLIYDGGIMRKVKSKSG